MSAARKMVEDNSEMDMTPMIDIVFNLLIFFMVVTDLNQKELSDLTLPIAYMAQEDKDDDVDDRIILNVDKHGFIQYKGKAVTLDELGSILHRAKENYVLKMKKLNKSGVEKLPSGAEASKLFVLLRADKDTPWQHVQWLMVIMAEQKLYKMQFATKKFRDGFYKKSEADLLGAVTQEEFKTLGKG